MNKRIIYFGVCFVLSIAINNSILAQGTELRPKIQRIVNKLRSADGIHLGYPVGFAGEPETNNKYFKLYKKLNSKATDLELLRLIEDSSNTIKLYAFNLLTKRGNTEVKKISLDHINDTSQVWVAVGCTGIIWQVNQFMLDCLRPDNAESKITLSQEEFEKYRLIAGY